MKRNASSDRFPADGQDGFALLMVVLFLLAVTAILAPLVLAARTDFLVASNSLRQDRFDLVAEGLRTVLSREVSAPELDPHNEDLSLISEPMPCRSGRLRVDVRIQDQRGLVDLNAANVALLEAGFMAIGLTRTEASDLADAAVAFRKIPEGKDTGRRVDPGIVSDGLKRRPFEAVEELYDFNGIRKIPAATLAEAFTIRSQRETVVGDRLSVRLGKILPSKPSSQYPFVAADNPFPQVFRIDVYVGARDTGVTGYAGAIINATGNATGDFQMMERLTNPDFLPDEGTDFSNAPACDKLFGPGVASILATITG